MNLAPLNRSSPIATVLLVGALAGACITVTQSKEVEVTKFPSREQNLELAKKVATEQRVGLLKQQIKDAVPGATDDHLQNMALTWNAHYSSNLEQLERVTVTVIIEKRHGADTESILDAAVKYLEQELQPANEAAKPSDVV